MSISGGPLINFFLVLLLPTLGELIEVVQPATLRDQYTSDPHRISIVHYTREVGRSPESCWPLETPREATFSVVDDDLDCRVGVPAARSDAFNHTHPVVLIFRSYDAAHRNCACAPMHGDAMLVQHTTNFLGIDQVPTFYWTTNPEALVRSKVISQPCFESLELHRGNFSLWSAPTELEHLVRAMDAVNVSSAFVRMRVTANPWEELFSGLPYALAFRVLMPSLFLATGLLALHYLWVWDKTLSTKSAALPPLACCGSVWCPRWFRQLREVPVIVLTIESFCMLLLGINFAVDGNWSVTPGWGSLNVRYMFATAFSGPSFCTTLLVGLLWNDTVNALTKFRVAKRFIARHFKAIVAIFALSILLEVVTALLLMAYGPGWVDIIGGSYYVTGQVLVSIYFIKSASNFSKTLLLVSKQSRNSLSIEGGSSVSADETRRRTSTADAAQGAAERMMWWLRVSSFAMLGQSATPFSLDE